MELEYIKKEVEDFDLKNSLNSKCLEVAHLFVRKWLMLWNIPHATIKRNK